MHADERERRFAAEIQRRGWAFYGERPDLVWSQVRLPPAQPREHRICRVIEGLFRGRPVLAFEYWYTKEKYPWVVGNKTHPRFHVTAVELPVDLPFLDVTPVLPGQEMLDRHPGAARPLAERFATAFRVSAADQRFAHDVLHADLMHWLLSGVGLPLPFRFEGRHLLCWAPGVMPPDWPERSADHLFAILDMVGHHVGWMGGRHGS